MGENPSCPSAKSEQTAHLILIGGMEDVFTEMPLNLDHLES